MERGKDVQQQLISGLPDDLAMECLVRVPYEFHSCMKSVSRDWRTLMSSPSFYKERRRISMAEHLVCLVQALPVPSSPGIESETVAVLKDSEEVETKVQQSSHPKPSYGLSIYNQSLQTWHRIRIPDNYSIKGGGIPMFCHCVAVPSSGKLILLGGWDPDTLEPLSDVYVLDLITGANEFKRAAPMSVARSFFACAVMGGNKVYVAGGHDNQKNALRSAEVYDVEADEWRMLPEMEEERDECQGLSSLSKDEEDENSSSKFWVVSGYSTENQGQFRADAECFDTETGVWSKVDGVWAFPTVSPKGLTMNNINGGTGSNQFWPEVIQLPDGMDNGSSPCVADIGKGNSGHRRIFVMGGSRKRSSGGTGSSPSCGECDGEGAYILEKDCNGKSLWNHIHTPPSFSGFPYSATCLRI